MRKLLLCLCAICYMLAGGVQAAPRFTHFTKQSSGLCYDGVKIILEDSRSNIWIGTYKGLSCYDGKGFRNYDRSDFGVDSDHVSSLVEDARGNIWIGTDYGIVIYDINKNKFSSFARNMVNTRVYCMARDGKDRIWIGVHGKGLFRSNGNTLELMPGTEEIEDVYRLAFDWQGRPFVASYCKSLYLYDNGTLNAICGEIFRFDDISGLVSRTVDEGSILYVAAKREGLCEVRPGADKPRRLYAVRGDQRPTALAAETGCLWLASTGGLVSCDLESGITREYGSVTGDPFSLSDEYVTCVLPDHSGGLWAGTNTCGVNYYSPDQDRFRKYWRTGNGIRLDGTMVRAFAETSDSRIWIGTERNGLLTMSPEGEPEPYTGTIGLPGNITALAADGLNLWIGSQRGVWNLDTGKGKARYYPQLGGSDEENDNRVVSLYRSVNGDIYVCTPVGVRRYDRERDSFRFIEPLKGVTVEQLAEDGSGNIWAASYSQGAFRYNPSNSELESYGIHLGKGPVHEMTSSMCIDRGGAVWVIGFSSGFYRYDRAGDIFEAYNKASVPGLPTELFFSALADQKGRMWLSSDTGLVEFEHDTRGVRTYTVADGLLSDSFTKCALKLSDGSMLFGCADGFIRFNPAEFRSPVPAQAGKPGFFHTPGGYATMAFTFCFVIMAITAVYAQRRSRKRFRKAQHQHDKRREEELYHEKMDFFSNIIHEIKTPLTLIRTPLQHLLDSGNPTDEQRADLGVIRNSTDYLDQLVKELLEFVRVEEHGYVPDLRNTDIVERLDFVCFNFSETAKNANIRLKYSSDPSSIVTAVDTKALSKIFNNLLHNAVKYCESWIDIYASVQGKKVVVSFRNDGTPIPREHRESIFQPFVRYTDKKSEYTQSFGIGLAQARKLAELQGGSLVLSDRADCTEFILSLPLRKVNDRPVEDEEVAPAPDANLPLLLLVEDNGDLAAYLKRKLKDNYGIIAVPSAEKALEKLEKYKPDLILTDIGLQSMSGVELCRKVSGNPATSHIPIIVISAISSVDTKIKCMENGATIYIEKPFSQDYLEACIKGVLEKRKNIKAAYREAPMAPAVDLPDRDEDFIRRLDELINANIGDASFTNKQMEQALFVSRSSLNRRVRALLGTTPNDYLRRRRLEVAADMLSRGKARINEISFSVGFNSPSYFAKCFKEAYGVLPADYMKQNNK